MFAAKVATEYRQKFGKDVVVDMFCYRRFGHNEGDDPTMTQPLMYAKIKDHPSTRELYAARLVGEGVATAGRGRRLDRRVRQPSSTPSSRPARPITPTRPTGWTASGRAWTPPSGESAAATPACRCRSCKDLGLKLTTIPERIDVHKTAASA